MKNFRKRLLAFLRVSERPDPPPGAGPALETFRASRRYLHYCVLAWIPKQIAAFVGLLFSLAFFGSINQPFVKAEGLDGILQLLSRIRIPLGPTDLGLSSILRLFEALAVVTWAAQLLFTGLLLKLSWELRWYMVGETSLRIRHGLWSLREQTMTIAKIQNMVVRQGPVQRLFGIADLEVHTAGGGAANQEQGDSGDAKRSLHIGHLRGLEDAPALRDKIRARLLEQSGAGLGEDHEPQAAGPGSSPAGSEDLLEAARSLSEEAKLLRAALAEPR